MNKKTQISKTHTKHKRIRLYTDNSKTNQEQNPSRILIIRTLINYLYKRNKLPEYRARMLTHTCFKYQLTSSISPLHNPSTEVRIIPICHISGIK